MARTDKSFATAERASALRASAGVLAWQDKLQGELRDKRHWYGTHVARFQTGRNVLQCGNYGSRLLCIFTRVKPAPNLSQSVA
jgi:hypothetical protein